MSALQQLLMAYGTASGGGGGTDVINMQFDAGNGSTTFTDTGTAASSWAIGSGSVVCSTTVVLDGVSSLFIPAGGSAYLTASNTSANRLPATGDFSLKFMAQASSWLNPGSTGAYLISIQDSGLTGSGTQFAIACDASSRPAIVYSDGSTRSVSSPGIALSINTPHSFEFRRTGNTLAIYANSTLSTSVSFSGSFGSGGSSPWRSGAPAFGNNGPANGMYFDKFTLTR